MLIYIDIFIPLFPIKSFFNSKKPATRCTIDNTLEFKKMNRADIQKSTTNSRLWIFPYRGSIRLGKKQKKNGKMIETAKMICLINLMSSMTIALFFRINKVKGLIKSKSNLFTEMFSCTSYDFSIFITWFIRNRFFKQP